jgi:F420-0:gamma-glutamyl ligase-like protein
VSSAQEVNLEVRGLYTAVVESTKLWFLGDVIPKSFIMKSVISIGDIVSSIGIMGFIITRMRKVHPVK